MYILCVCMCVNQLLNFVMGILLYSNVEIVYVDGSLVKQIGTFARTMSIKGNLYVH